MNSAVVVNINEYAIIYYFDLYIYINILLNDTVISYLQLYEWINLKVVREKTLNQPQHAPRKYFYEIFIFNSKLNNKSN